MFLTIYTAGVSVGDPVLRTGKPLSVELGPGNAPYTVKSLSDMKQDYNAHIKILYIIYNTAVLSLFIVNGCGYNGYTRWLT